MTIHHTFRRAIRHRSIIHKRLQRRLLLFPIIALGLLAFVTIDALTNAVSPLWIIIGGLIGLGVGYLVGQIYKIYWREDLQKVVSGFDRLTIILIIVYVAVRIGSERLASQYIHGPELMVVTYSFLGGLLFGRMLGVLRKVNRVLLSQTVLDHLKHMPIKTRRHKH